MSFAATRTAGAVPVPPRALALPVLGKTVCRVGFGTGGLLRIDGARRRRDVLAAALASGITHFDTRAALWVW